MNAISVETPRGINFSSLPLERKLVVKNLGRPIPEISITKPQRVSDGQVCSAYEEENGFFIPSFCLHIIPTCFACCMY